MSKTFEISIRFENETALRLKITFGQFDGGHALQSAFGEPHVQVAP
jgi:hypothetical protein